MSLIREQIVQAEKRWHDHKHDLKDKVAALKSFGEGGPPDWHKMDDRSRFQYRLERQGEFAAAQALADGEELDFDPLERIIANNELTGIQFFERGMVAARSVARVKILTPTGAAAGFGSGVMVSPRLFLTNNHVLGQAETAARSVAEFGYLDSISGPREAYPFRFQPQDFFVTDAALDFTLVAVEPVNDKGARLERRGYCPLIPMSGKAVVGERVNIIQHPAGERMQATLRDNRIVSVIDDFLQYVADTQAGSSGSPVFNDQWEMAALHHSGVPRKENGHIMLTNGKRWSGKASESHLIDWVSNEGVRISRIVKHMRELDLPNGQRVLFEQAFNPPQPLDIWDLLDGRVAPFTPNEVSTPGLSGPVTDENGNQSWLFRLSFGPAGGGPNGGI